ncbi:hypothetical protein PDJAM_G00234210 [Pangasius djambal]|uniref:Uncharacterized protein n=1 Tax=Pangasius djambal TaxID=1691987 RepID=A0ACC5YFR8_9TELE|nr:hypothetical protein [Pangasius djambal]
MNMYRVARTTNINGVDVPYNKCLRGSNSLEGFHKALPNMIPGPHCAAHTYQVYLINGIARRNSDRSSDAVYGGKGRHHKIYSAPLIKRLNTQCRQLFGEAVEENFHAPADVTSNELLGLEYLFNQSTEEKVGQPGQPDPDEDDETYQSDTEATDDMVASVPAHINLTTDETTTARPPAFQEDSCSPNPLPGFQQLERFFSQIRSQNSGLLSTGESGPFSLRDILKDGPSLEEEVVHPGQPDPDEDDEAYQSDTEAADDVVASVPAHTKLTTTARPPAFQEDSCSPNLLPAVGKVLFSAGGDWPD